MAGGLFVMLWRSNAEKRQNEANKENEEANEIKDSPCNLLVDHIAPAEDRADDEDHGGSRVLQDGKQGNVDAQLAEQPIGKEYDRRNDNGDKCGKIQG